jgi:hypothetical protein
MKKLIIIFFTATICFSAHSQDGNLKDHPGQLHFQYVSPTGDIHYKYSKEEDLKIKAKIEAIVKNIQTNEGFNNLKGVEIYITGNLVDNYYTTFPWLKSIPSEIYVAVHPWFSEDGKIYSKCVGCSPGGFTVHINLPHYLYNGQASPSGRDVYDTDGSLINLEPNKIMEKDGVVFYENATIVIAKPGVPLYIPLTVRQYDNVLLEDQLKMMKEHPEDKMTYQFFYDKLKEEMAQFSEEDLDKPAYQYGFGGSPGPLLEGARPIVKINKAYFEQSKPRTDAQLIIITYGGLQNDPENLYFTDEYSSFQVLKTVEALKTFNFAGMIKLLD